MWRRSAFSADSAGEAGPVRPGASRPPPPREGAIGAFATSAEPHTAQATRPAARCSSKAAEERNHASKACPSVHLRA